MSIDKDKIKHISKLARISVDDKEIDGLTKDLSSILNQPLRSRKDEINDGKIREKILENSPKKNEEFFVVPKVIE